MTVSVIMPTFNGRQWIAGQLDALANQAFDEWELIVADNGSTDGTPAVVERWRHRFPACRLLDTSDVRGQSHARNQAARHASGQLILFTDQDDIVTPGWLNRLADGLVDAPIVTGPVVNFVDGRPPSRENVQAAQAPVRVGPFTPPAGCNMGIRRAVFLDLGGFDETMTRSWEDTDLGIRAGLGGFSTVWVDDAIVLHRRPSSMRTMWRKEFAYGRGWTTLERRYPELSPNGWGRPLLRRTGWVALRAPYVMSPRHRHAWMGKAAGVAGRLAERLHPSS